MLRVTDPQLENLMFLRDVTIPWMREHPERVDLERYDSECGTFRCVLGWYAMQRHSKTWGQMYDLRRTAYWGEGEFGVNGVHHAALFGPNLCGTLDDRARYLDELIAQRLVALESR